MRVVREINLCSMIVNKFILFIIYKTLSKASKGFGINISEPEWVEMNNRDKFIDWKKCVEEYLNDVKYQYQFVVFLLDNKNDHLYSKLKKHSLCSNGYVSQVIKTNSLRKNAMSVCSKILLQINAKLRGVNYKAEMDNHIKERNIMVIGVDSSHIKGKRTCVAMVSTIDKDYTDFYNYEEIIEEKNK